MERNLIVKMYFGSHLYGTATADSDLDFKGVFLPTREQVLLNRISKSYNQTTKRGTDTRNTADDIDTEIYSLHYFIELACQGQTVALDMLHAPPEMILNDSDTWREIVTQRERFYTRNLQAFIGYARRQAAKYGIKGSRLNAAREVIRFLRSKPEETLLVEIWDDLPRGEHTHFLIEKTPNGLRQYQVVGKRFQETVRIAYVLPILEKFETEYGKRAQLAARNEGIDWKAVSHALRAAYQTRQLLTERTIRFPLDEADYLLQVKQGKRDYTTDVVPTLEALMNKIESLSKASDLPEKVDRKYWERFLVDTLTRKLF